MDDDIRTCPVCYESIKVSSAAQSQEAICTNCGSLVRYHRPGGYSVRSGSRAAEVVQAGKLHGGPYFQAGDVVKVLAGAFESFEGKVVFADPAESLVSVSFEVFGRDTVTEIWKRHLQLL